MENYLMPINEVAQILQYSGERAIRRTHDWLLSRGVHQFRRGGFYSREVILELLRKESEKCILGKEDNSIMSPGKCVWGNKRLKSKSTARDILNSKMQESMQTE